MSEPVSDPEIPSPAEIGSLDGDVLGPPILDHGMGALAAGSVAFLAGDFEEALECWEASKDLRCCFNAAVLHQCGLGVEANVDQALRRYRDARSGVASAMNNEAMLLDAAGGPCSDSLALLEQAHAAGDRVAGCNLAARRFADARAHGEVAGLVRRLARGGHPAALCALGSLSYAGPADAAADHALAARCFARAAATGYPAAMYRLGGLKMRGEGTASDAPAGRRLVRRAASLGYRTAQLRVGRCHAAGTPAFPPRPESALAWLSLARDAWDLADAQVHETLLDRMPVERVARAFGEAGEVRTRAALAAAAWAHRGSARSGWSPRSLVQRLLGL